MLELSESPRLKSRHQMLGLIVGERLGADEPGALQNENQDEQGNHDPAEAANGKSRGGGVLDGAGLLPARVGIGRDGLVRWRSRLQCMGLGGSFDAPCGSY